MSHSRMGDHVNPGRDLSAQEMWKTVLRTPLPDDDVGRGQSGCATQAVWRTVPMPSEQPVQGLQVRQPPCSQGNWLLALNGWQQPLQLGKAPVMEETFTSDFPALLPVVELPQ